MLKNKNEQLTGFGPTWSELNKDNDQETKRGNRLCNVNKKWRGGEC